MNADVFRQATPRRRLSDEHRQWLVDGSGILPGIVKERGYYTLDAVNVDALIKKNIFGKKTIDADTWLGIPIYRPDGEHHCDILRLFGGKSKSKYLWPSGFRLALDVHRKAIEWLDDAEYDIAFTEGVKKCDALLSAALRENIKIVPVALQGMWGWRAQGEAGGSVCPDIWEIPMSKRTMHIISDSDYRFNDDVRKGWNSAALYFSSKNNKNDFDAHTRLVVIPPTGNLKQGADDYLVTGHTVGELLALGASPSFIAENGDPLTQQTLSYRRGIEVLSGPIEKIPYMMEPIMPEQSICLLAGDSGTYKTWGALSFMLDGAFGYEWQGHPAIKIPDAQFTSVYVNKEMGARMLDIRLRQLATNKDYADHPDYEDIVEKYIVIVEDKELDLNHVVHRERLENLIIETEAKLVILDSLSMCWTGDENKASDVAAFFMQLRGITERTGVSWILIHHLVKPQGKNRSIDKFTVRGSGQIVQQSDCVYLFSLFEPSEPLEEGSRYVACHHAKTRTTIELPAWVATFKDNDGLFFSLNYTGLLSEIKAKEYSNTHDPQQLMAWMIQAMTAMSALKPSTGSPGIRTGNLIALLTSTWPAHMKSTPSESTLRRYVKTLTEKGYLTCLEENRNLGDLYILTNEEILNSTE